MSDHYAVLGNPIGHSRSPEIHAAFAAQTGDDICYERILVPPGKFSETAAAFIAKGGKGLNVTVPCKEDAYRFVDQLTARARRAGAVNTLIVSDNTVLGDNTDGAGLARDLTDNLHWVIRHQRVLILGAGGAVRGILEPLLAEHPHAVVIANRTEQKARTLAAAFDDLGPVTGGSYEDARGRGPYDLVINATSASLNDELLPLSDDMLAARCCCYDMMYGSTDTVFLAWMQAHGVENIADGLGMLVEQAALSYALWRNKTPDTAPVISAMRDLLTASK